MTTNPVHCEGFVLVEGTDLIIEHNEGQWVEAQFSGRGDCGFGLGACEIDSASVAPSDSVKGAKPECVQAGHIGGGWPDYA